MLFPIPRWLLRKLFDFFVFILSLVAIVYIVSLTDIGAQLLNYVRDTSAHYVCEKLRAGIVPILPSFATNYICYAIKRPLDEIIGTDLKGTVKRLSQNYPTLTNKNVDDLMDIGRKWQSKDRNKPLCLLVTGNNGREFAIELGEQLHRFTTSWRQSEIIESTPELTYKTLIHSLERMGDVRLQRGFEDSDAVDTQLRVFTILDIERLKWDAHKALHFFVDDTSSPVKKALFVFHLNSSTEAYFEKPEECINRISKFLYDSWIESGGSADQIRPILARIKHYSICLT